MFTPLDDLLEGYTNANKSATPKIQGTIQSTETLLTVVPDRNTAEFSVGEPAVTIVIQSGKGLVSVRPK
jgi:hypothetical protein